MAVIVDLKTGKAVERPFSHWSTEGVRGALGIVHLMYTDRPYSKAMFESWANRLRDELNLRPEEDFKE